ncbi:MAG: Rrf2 family transcriptional regulator [Spirochaetaceae bacterium]|nr:Rrf2 family transcriptional regulator [Spirochaetaceae bacterium]
MRTTTRGLYALKAMLVLATDSTSEKPLALHRIAEQEEISAEFLQQIFFRLRKSGLIAAYRGPRGGFYLAKDMKAITALDILEAAGESLEISPCAEMKKGKHQPCPKLPGCEAGHFWLSMEKEIKTFASSRTLEDLVNSGRAANSASMKAGAY